MSLEAFQQAVAHYVAAPARCLALRADPALADGFALDARERRRLVAMVAHWGMSYQCTLYRANRLTPLGRSLPRSCALLGADLVPLLERFWASADEAELQFKREAQRFGHWLLERIAAGELRQAGLEAAVREELRDLEGRFGPVVQ
ncbi:MAG: hypothetical protein QM777_11725 [Pseudorhodoferax sp.]